MVGIWVTLYRVFSVMSYKMLGCFKFFVWGLIWKSLISVTLSRLFWCPHCVSIIYLFLAAPSAVCRILVPPAAAKSLQSFPTLCDPIQGSPPGSPVPGILQARTVKWVAISFSNAWKWSSQPWLRDPLDWSLPGSSIHGIFQARVLEWGAIAFSVSSSTRGQNVSPVES